MPTRRYILFAGSKQEVLHSLDFPLHIGNCCSGADTDKFEKFSLTVQPASEVKAPLIKECYVTFECRLYDKTLKDKYDFFIFEIVKAHVAVSPKYPETVHYRGDSTFMVSGKNIKEYSAK